MLIILFTKSYLFNLFVLIFICRLHSLLSVPNVIRIGGIFEKGSNSLEQAFKSAVDRINSDNKTLSSTRLEAIAERIEQGDSYQASKKACGLVERGVAAIFGPQSMEASTHVQSICSALHIPHIEARMDYKPFPANQSVNLFPPPKLIAMAIKELIKLKRWRKFAIVYKENEALLRLEEILKDEEFREKRIIVRQFETSEYKIILKELHKKHKIKNLIVDVPHQYIPDVLRDASSVDMLTDYHDYIFSTFNFHAVDLSDFHRSGTNISALSLMDLQSADFHEIVKNYITEETKTSTGYVVNRNAPPETTSEFTIEVALMYDAVKQFAKALEGLIKPHNDLRTAILSCDSEDKWQYGDGLTNFMKIVKTRGVTGDIQFDHRQGLRSDAKLDILELKTGGKQRVGNYTQRGNITYRTSYVQSKREEAELILANKTFHVVAVLNRPYVMLNDTPGAENLTGNDRYMGFCIDLLDEISRFKPKKDDSRLENFTYEIRILPPTSGAHGSKDEKGEWNGLIRELLEGRADFAIADLTITRERQGVVDFTHPFMNLGIGILFKKPSKEPPRLFSFMSPLAVEVWIYLLTAFLGVTLFLFVVARFSPYEWINPHPCIRNPEELENNFTMKNTLWFTIGCLMQQGCDIMPRALSTRVLAASWWFFILILVSSYTANLAAFLTVERMVNPIENVEDLSKQTKIHYGCVAGGATMSFFKNSNSTLYSRMWSFMESTRPSVFVDSNERGIDRVKKGEYAFLMESTSIEYVMERECDLYQVNGVLDSKSYGIATPQRSKWREMLSDRIVGLHESGTLSVLKDKWWSMKMCEPKDGAQKASGAASELGLANVGGVFVVLAIGSSIAVIICVGEFIWKMKQVPIEERDHIFVELIRELKHVICCYGSTRPIRKARMGDASGMSMPLPPNGIPGMPLRGYSDFSHPIHNEYIPANYGLGQEMIGPEGIIGGPMGPDDGVGDGGYL
ncbi:glutamate receptor ionotropic, kainate 2-like [Brevipalpus obovatus]|uniref:glutamate receptor ionotropic, kainate 2-like n=1 Tax=Brevipalpus obovatus TaxID=246614 RepID=UPI003D9DCE02